MNIAVVGLTVSADARVPPGDAQLAIDILWALSAPGDGLEHITGRVGSGMIHLVFFYLAGGTGEADRSARLLCERAISIAPQFRGWRLT